MFPVLEAVPNFSSGRSRSFLDRLIRAAEEAGTEVLDASADPDHHRSVLTLVGVPEAVEEAAVALAALAKEEIDLRAHRGVHPRVGAIDVLPFVPLHGLTIEQARESARRVGVRLANEVGLPVFFYAEASDPRGRGLADLRRGGFEALVDGFPEGRRPDLLPPGWAHPGAHPSAGVVCVGARPLLLAWNVEVEGIDADALESLARGLRERNGGFAGVRALGIVRGGQARMQISMNLEDVSSRSAFEVFQAVEARVAERGGRVTGTEVIGAIPDRLLFEAGANRLCLLRPDPNRVMAPRLVRHLDARIEAEVAEFRRALASAGPEAPAPLRQAADRLLRALSGSGDSAGDLS